MLDVAGGGDVFRSDDLFHLVDNAVNGKDVAFLYADGTVFIDVNTVRIRFGFPYGKFLVVECTKDEFILIQWEFCCVEISIQLVSAIDDAVIYDDLAYGVEFVLVGESIP